MTTPAESSQLQAPRKGFLSILYNTGWLTIARVSGDIAGIVLFISISRNLGLSAIGTYSYAFALSQIAAAAVGLGMDEFGLREYSRLTGDARRAMFRRIMGLQINLLVLVGVVLAIYLSLTGASLEQVIVVFVVAVHVLTFQFALMYFIPSFAAHSMFVPALAEFVCRVGAICIGILIVTIFSGSLGAGMAPLAVGTTLLLLIALISARYYNGEIRPALDWKSMRAVAMDVWPFAVSTIIYSFFNRIAVVLLTSIRGAAETGIYATALKVYEFGLMPLYLLGIAVFPTLSREFERTGGEFGSTADKYLRTSMAVAAVLAWGIVFVAPPALAPLLGAEFEAASLATRLMAIVAFLGALDLACLRVMLAMHLQHQRVRIQGVSVAACVALNLLLIPHFGAYGAIAATVVTQLMMLTCYFWLFWRREPSKHLLRTVRSFTLIAVLVVGSAATAAAVEVNELIIAAGSLGLLAAALLVSGFVPSPLQLWRAWSAKG